MVAYLPRLAHAHGIDPAKALWLGVLNPLVLMHFVAGAHNDALMVGLMIAGLALAVERHPIAGIVLIGLAGAVKPIALVALPFAGLLWAGTHSGWPQRIWAWVRCSVIVMVLFVVLSRLAGVGLGWIASLGNPGAVRTWLSPPTALGMLVGGALELLGIVDSTDGAVTFFRAIAILIGAAIGLWLVLRPEGRPAVRGAGLGLLTIVLLGPVVQPWYVLWTLPLLAATGLAGWQLRTAVLATAVLVLHGMVESNSTADTLLDVRDGLAALFAVVIVGVVMLSSPGERRLLLGDPVDRGIRPTSAAARARAGALVMHRLGCLMDHLRAARPHRTGSEAMTPDQGASSSDAISRPATSCSIASGADRGCFRLSCGPSPTSTTRAIRSDSSQTARTSRKTSIATAN